MLSFRVDVKSLKPSASPISTQRNITYEKGATDFIKKSFTQLADTWADWFFDEAIRHLKWSPTWSKKTFKKDSFYTSGTGTTGTLFANLYMHHAKKEMESRNQFVSGKTYEQLQKGKFTSLHIDKSKRIANVSIRLSERFYRYNSVLTMKERVGKNPQAFKEVVQWFMKKGILKDARNSLALAVFLTRRITGLYKMQYSGKQDLRKTKVIDKKKKFDKTSNKLVYKKGSFFGDKEAFSHIEERFVYEVIAEKTFDNLEEILAQMANNHFNANLGKLVPSANIRKLNPGEGK